MNLSQVLKYINIKCKDFFSKKGKDWERTSTRLKQGCCIHLTLSFHNLQFWYSILATVMSCSLTKTEQANKFLTSVLSHDLMMGNSIRCDGSSTSKPGLNLNDRKKGEGCIYVLMCSLNQHHPVAFIGYQKSCEKHFFCPLSVHSQWM